MFAALCPIEAMIKLSQTIKKLSKVVVARYKKRHNFVMQKSITFIYTNNNQSRNYNRWENSIYNSNGKEKLFQNKLINKIFKTHMKKIIKHHQKTQTKLWTNRKTSCFLVRVFQHHQYVSSPLVNGTISRKIPVSFVWKWLILKFIWENKHTRVTETKRFNPFKY